MKNQKKNIPQLNNFFDFVCPNCGEEIDLEVLINVFRKKRGDEKSKKNY
jgi:predicted RNA-binding Zn-ribbon protein involved in translation (DUF1610 family)